MSTKTNKAPVTMGGAPPHPPAQPVPTDLELMLYADGELEGEQLTRVEAYLAQDEAARQKMLAIDMVSGVVREQALASASSADDIADLVMASLAVEAKKVEKKADVAPVHAGHAAPAGPARRKPANDNARGLLFIAAVAAAAAAALLLWSRGPAPADRHDVASGRPPAPTVTAPVPHDDVVKVEAPRPDGDVEHGVEVAAVDFGTHTGAVFYVPSGNAAATTTTVVWLSDDSSGGNE